MYSYIYILKKYTVYRRKRTNKGIVRANIAHANGMHTCNKRTQHSAVPSPVLCVHTQKPSDHNQIRAREYRTANQPSHIRHRYFQTVLFTHQSWQSKANIAMSNVTVVTVSHCLFFYSLMCIVYQEPEPHIFSI